MRNMGPATEPWGRWAEGRITELESKAAGISTNSRSDGSVQNASVDNLAIQIRELYSRQSHSVPISSMQTDNFGSLSSSPIVTQNISLPVPTDAQRIGWLSIQGTMDIAGVTDAFSNGFVMFEIDGVRIGQDSAAFPYAESVTADWGPISQFAASSFSAGPLGGGTLTIRLMGKGLAMPGLRRIIFNNIRATVQYGQKAV